VGIVVTDHLEENNTFCTACHLHEKKFTEFHLVQGTRDSGRSPQPRR
jgi:hypothetical protein